MVTELWLLIVAFVALICFSTGYGTGLPSIAEKQMCKTSFEMAIAKSKGE
jgi:hypothetical protein